MLRCSIVSNIIRLKSAGIICVGLRLWVHAFYQMLRVSLNHKNVRLFCRNAENNINAWNLKAVPLAPQCEFNIDRLRFPAKTTSQDVTSIMTARCISLKQFSRLSGPRSGRLANHVTFWRSVPNFYVLTVSLYKNRKVGMASKTKCLTLMPWLVLAFPICTLWSANADCDGWSWSTVRRDDGRFQKDTYGILALGMKTTGIHQLR